MEISQTIMYKVLNHHIAPNLKESFSRMNVYQNTYDLRNNHTDLALPKTKRELPKRTFKYSGAKLWNNLSPEAKLAESLTSFKRQIYRT